MATFNCESCSLVKPYFLSSPKSHTCDACFEDESVCNLCGDKMSWCECCQVFTSTCCCEYGTCQCS